MVVEGSVVNFVFWELPNVLGQCLGSCRQRDWLEDKGVHGLDHRSKAGDHGPTIEPVKHARDNPRLHFR